VLANDGSVRWQGDLVGKLIAGDEVLRPRVRIVADDQLTGPARELVATRLDLWLKTHIEKLLAPLFALSAAEDITGMARGVAFQLVEALGVLERQRVSEEVKGLDQPSRATLRKYGVRFGAYHIYLPLLLKPAPRALATQLWALKNEPAASGVDDLLHLAASGRTSIPVGNETPKTLYRTAGYRVTGERAVRVDILERLADLIRPALSWREGMNGEKPAGAFDGRGFTVTGAMTSLTGASGEDFASILRSLGYRMDRKPKPATTSPEAASVTNPVEAKAAEETKVVAEEAAAPPPEAAVEPAATESAAAPPVASAAPEAAPVRVASSRSLLPNTDFFPSAVAPVAPPALAAEPAPQQPVEESSAVVEAAIAPAAPEAASAEAAAPATEVAATSTEPEMIEVWRPAGRSDRKPQHARRPRPQRRDQNAPAAAQATAPADQAAQPAADASAEQKPDQHRERRGGDDKRADRQEQNRGRHDRQQRQEWQKKRDERNNREGRPPRRDRGAPVDRADRDMYYAKPGMRIRHNKEADPNSPFAKLAALKQQLEDGGKERQ
jgi:ATP-dependent RNA helicase SUPV3L1/SUV3